MTFTGGRYIYRHDRVLTELAASLENNTDEKDLSVTERAHMHQLRFPEEIISTSYQPYIVLWSRAAKQFLFVELNVPWESRAEDAVRYS